MSGSIRSFNSVDFCANSCTRFSPNNRIPAAKASRIALDGCIFDTAIKADVVPLSSGSFASRGYLVFNSLQPLRERGLTLRRSRTVGLKRRLTPDLAAEMNNVLSE